jgi:hypothetical protein
VRRDESGPGIPRAKAAEKLDGDGSIEFGLVIALTESG